MDRKKKIAIVTGYFLPHLGGVERYVAKLSEELSKLGNDCVIITSKHENDLSFEDNISGCKIYRLPTRKLFKQRYPILRKDKEFFEVVDKIKNEDIDIFIVNTRFHLTSLFFARLAKKSQKPVYLIEHGTAHFSVNNRILDFFGAIYEHILTNILKKYVDKYFGVSKNCNKWLKHFRIMADGVWYNGIKPQDIDIATDKFFNEFHDDEIVISYAGRLIKEKGVMNLVDAFSAIKNKVSDKKITLAIAGDGPLCDELRKVYSDENSSIRILGKLDFKEVMSLYKRTNIFVYPSLYPEGLPTSILEAGLMNCAIVATPKGGTEEVIIDKEYGIIIDGSLKSLQEGLLKLITDDEYRKKCGDNVKCRVEEVFDWRIIAKNIDNKLRKDLKNDSKN